MFLFAAFLPLLYPPLSVLAFRSAPASMSNLAHSLDPAATAKCSPCHPPGAGVSGGPRVRLWILPPLRSSRDRPCGKSQPADTIRGVLESWGERQDQNPLKINSSSNSNSKDNKSSSSI